LLDAGSGKLEVAIERVEHDADAVAAEVAQPAPM
jgi:hypothetical protein